MKIIGLTGPIGSGKSEAAKIFADLGATVIDADDLAKKATSFSAVLDKIQALFGPSVFAPDGSLNRRALGEIVFNDPVKLKALEALIHPEVRRLFRERIETSRRSCPQPSLVVAVIPLLFKVLENYPEIEAVIVISAPRELCIRRIQDRDGSSAEEARKKMAAQLPLSEQVARAAFILDNSGSKEQLTEQVEKLYRQLVQPSQR